MRVFRWASLVTCLMLVAPCAARAQAGTIAGTVVDAQTGARIGYSVVTVLPGGRERFTSDSGTFVLTDLPAGPVQLRVRRLGFEPYVVTVDVRPDQTTTVRVVMKPFAVTLSAMQVVANRQCADPGPPDSSQHSPLAAIFGQLEQNAEQYRLLMQEYPFVSTYEVTTAGVRPSGTDATIEPKPARVDSRRHWTYAPGRVVENRRGQGTWVNDPTLDVFADRRFTSAHCFWYGGVVPVDGDSLIRIDFRVSDRIDDPDLNGSMYLDPKTFLIRESRLRLSSIPDELERTDSATVVTRFDELLPGVPFIADIVSAVYLRRDDGGDDPDPEFRREEERRRVAVEFTGQKPDHASVPTIAPVVAPWASRLVEHPRILGVFDDETGKPIDSVLVRDSITTRSGYTTATGTVRLDFISQAGGVLALERRGYEALTLRVSAAPDDTVPLTVTLVRVKH